MNLEIIENIEIIDRLGSLDFLESLDSTQKENPLAANTSQWAEK